jgi:hypothetical protein
VEYVHAPNSSSKPKSLPHVAHVWHRSEGPDFRNGLAVVPENLRGVALPADLDTSIPTKIPANYDQWQKIWQEITSA